MPLTDPFTLSEALTATNIADERFVEDLVAKLFEGESDKKFFTGTEYDETQEKIRKSLLATGKSGKAESVEEFNKQLVAYRKALISRRVEHFLVSEVKADTLYAPEQYEVIKDWTFNAYYAKCDNGPGREQLLENSKKLYAARGKALDELNNVLRQKNEIIEAELNPGKIDLLKARTQMLDHLPFESSGLRWNAKHEGYGEPTESHLASIIGGTETTHRAILEHNKPIAWTVNPPKLRRNSVFDLERDAKDGLELTNKALEVYLNEGQRELTEDEKNQFQTRNRVLHALSNLGEGAAVGGLHLLKKLGRGMFSQSKASETNRYARFLAQRNELIATLLWRLGSQADYLRVLKMVNDQLAGSPDLMDQATFTRMQNIITEAITNETNAPAAEVKAFQDRINKINDDTLKGLQGHVNREDEMWKYRLFQALLLATPFGAFSVFNFFDYVDPIANLLGPIFSSSQSLGEGMGAVATSDLLDPFGVADAVGLDKAIEWVMNVPIIKELGQLVDFAIDNELTQTVGGAVVSVLVESPLTMVAVAAGYSALVRAPAEIKHHNEQKKFTEDQKKALSLAGEEFSKEQEKNLEQRAKSFSGKRFEATELANEDAKLVEFILSSSQEVVDTIFPKVVLDDGKTLKGKKADGSLTAGDLFEAFSARPQEREECFKSFVFFEGLKEKFKKELEEPVKKDDPGLAGEDLRKKLEEEAQKKVLEQLKSKDALSPEETNKLSQEQKDKIGKEFIIKEAEKAGLTSSKKIEKEKVEDLRAQLKRKDSEEVVSRAKEGMMTPDPTKVQNPTATGPLFGPRIPSSGLAH